MNPDDDQLVQIRPQAIRAVGLPARATSLIRRWSRRQYLYMDFIYGDVSVVDGDVHSTLHVWHLMNLLCSVTDQISFGRESLPDPMTKMVTSAVMRNGALSN